VPLITVEFIPTNDRIADKLTTNYLVDIDFAIPQMSLFCADFVDNVACVRGLQAWLIDVLSRIADHKINRVDELLSWNCPADWSKFLDAHNQ
jgi:hypothetical protein